MRRRRATIFLFVIVALMVSPITGQGPARNWPMFRGPSASGVADDQAPPLRWNAGEGLNVQWKTFIPGLGHSSPVVWGDRLFVTTAINLRGETASDPPRGLPETKEPSADMVKHSWRVYGLDLKTGRIQWERIAHEGVPRAKRDVSASYANSTPATDGRYIVAFFGSEGLYAYKLDGTLVWTKDLGVLDAGYTPDPQSHWGFASSPVIFRDVVIVQCDRKTNSFLAAFRLSDGAEVWRTPRAEDSSWSTPVIYDGSRRVELLASGTNYYRGYDPLTGRELWRLKGGIDVKIPTPVASQELFFFMGGQGISPRYLRAVRAGVSGDITPPGDETTTAAIAWTSRGAWTILTPLVYRGLLYVGTTGGVLGVYDARTGEQVYRARLGSGAAFAASPVAADGRVYFTSQDGDVYVIKAGPSYQLLATNPLDELTMATPAIADSMFIVRGLHHVFAFGQRERWRSAAS